MGPTFALPHLIKLLFLLSFIVLASQPTLADTKLHLAESIALKAETQFNIERKFVGSVFAQQNANLGFELAGKVSSLLANTGDIIAKGDILAKQDTELLEIERKELSAQLSQTEADIALVAANLKRLSSLKQKGYTSDQSVDELQAQRKSLNANKARIQASLKANQARLNKSQLIAPFAGQIATRNVAEGQVVNAGEPVFQILQRDKQEIKVGIPVRVINKLDKTAAVSATIGTEQLPVTLITQGALVDANTRTVQLRFALPEDKSFIPGQLAFIHVQEQQQEAGFWVPMTALTDGVRGLWNVFVAVKQGDSWLVERRDIRVAYADKSAAYIHGALAADERVITSGVHKLVPGQAVRLADSDWSR